MALIFDTHAAYWMAIGDTRLSARVIDVLRDGAPALFLSAITAYEYSDLVARGRLISAPPLRDLMAAFGFEVLDFPASVVAIAALLPAVHRDPIDRMLIAHAISADLTIVTCDTTVHKYPVRTLW